MGSTPLCEAMDLIIFHDIEKLLGPPPFTWDVGPTHGSHTLVKGGGFPYVDLIIFCCIEIFFGPLRDSTLSHV